MDKKYVQKTLDEFCLAKKLVQTKLPEYMGKISRKK